MKTVNNAKGLARLALAMTAGYICFTPVAQPVAADPNSSLPKVIEDGLSLWAKRGEIDLALDARQKGGILEGDNKIRVLSNYFRQLDRTMGNYKSRELLETKRIGQTSQVVYVALNFERAAVYGRFVLYRSSEEWVVQNMDFSTKPEAIMPWLIFEGVKYSE
jgi:hypothetical protein